MLIPALRLTTGGRANIRLHNHLDNVVSFKFLIRFRIEKSTWLNFPVDSLFSFVCEFPDVVGANFKLNLSLS